MHAKWIANECIILEPAWIHALVISCIFKLCLVGFHYYLCGRLVNDWVPTKTANAIHTPIMYMKVNQKQKMCLGLELSALILVSLV